MFKKTLLCSVFALIGSSSLLAMEISQEESALIQKIQQSSDLNDTQKDRSLSAVKMVNGVIERNKKDEIEKFIKILENHRTGKELPDALINCKLQQLKNLIS